MLARQFRLQIGVIGAAFLRNCLKSYRLPTAGRQSYARFEEKRVKTREVYRGTPTEDEPFFTESGVATMRNSLDSSIGGSFSDSF